ncbi:hypothetical protein GWK47_012433 [Chionoecetes opilio]|uniref:Uncharacterized protein n=1 Tax=Chionoecetes opilio TaxID=41210 RepID=A0A8J5CPG2_CHIOP|nr:hypothetical protein GWK47_012433 [Chionoecetes opilio]
MGVMDGLWGPAEKLGADTSPALGFEDSFSPQSNHLEETLHSPDNETYIPLQDSRQYLAGLESKLANVQGRTASARKTESRRLLDALAASRSTHTAQLMRNTEPPCGSLPTNDTAPLSSTIDPQGALGAMLRRVAPDRVALTHERCASCYRLICWHRCMRLSSRLRWSLREQQGT